MTRPTLSILGLTPLVALAACQARIDGDRANGNESDVHISVDQHGGKQNQLTIALPGFDAKLRLPDMNLAGHMDLDGIKLPPSTKVVDMDINGHEGDKDSDKGHDNGDVRLSFTDPQPPAALIAYYRKAAADAGYAIGAVTANALAATHGTTRLSLAVTPDGSGSRGRIDVSGG